MMLTLPHEPDIIRFTNRMLLCMESTPLEQEQKLQAVLTLVNYVFYFVLDDYQHQRNVSAILKEQGELPGGGDGSPSGLHERDGCGTVPEDVQERAVRADGDRRSRLSSA